MNHGLWRWQIECLGKFYDLSTRLGTLYWSTLLHFLIEDLCTCKVCWFIEPIDRLVLWFCQNIFHCWKLWAEDRAESEWWALLQWFNEKTLHCKITWVNTTRYAESQGCTVTSITLFLSYNNFLHTYVNLELIQIKDILACVAFFSRLFH